MMPASVGGSAATGVPGPATCGRARRGGTRPSGLGATGGWPRCGGTRPSRLGAAGRFGGSGGLSLVEVLIALAVLALVSAAFAALQLTSLRAARQAQESRLAAALLAVELEAQLLTGPASAGAAACLLGGAGLPGANCTAETWCSGAAGDCALRTVRVSLVLASGRGYSLLGAGYRPLEQAPVLRQWPDEVAP